MLGLDEARTLDALSLTLAQATGTAEMTRGARSVVRGVRDAFGAHAGVLAARLAERGVAGFDRPFEGDAGLFALYAGGRYEPGALLDDLGRRYEGADLSYKPWPCCRGTHAAVEAALRWRDRGVDPATVTGVGITGAPLNRMLCEPRDQRTAPATAIDAKFSLPYTVARALVHGSVGLDAFTPAALAEPAVLALAARVRYEIDEGAAPTQCRLSVTAGGEHHDITVDEAPGGPDRPLSDADLHAKFASCAALAREPLTAAASARIGRAGGHAGVRRRCPPRPPRRAYEYSLNCTVTRWSVERKLGTASDWAAPPPAAARRCGRRRSGRATRAGTGTGAGRRRGRTGRRRS